MAQQGQVERLFVGWFAAQVIQALPVQQAPQALPVEYLLEQEMTVTPAAYPPVMEQALAQHLREQALV